MRDYVIAAISVLSVVMTALFGLLTNRQKFREDLQAKYDATIHEQRTAVYLPLWKKLELLARFAPPETVTMKRLDELSTTLREWFFDKGGLYLSDESRQAYLNLQETITHVRNREISDRGVDESSLRRIQDKASALRASLSKDIGSRKVSFRF
jgi:hypothetical protein